MGTVHSSEIVGEPSELQFGVVRGWDSRRAMGRGGLGLFVPDFHYRIFYWVADEEMSLIRL